MFRPVNSFVLYSVPFRVVYSKAKHKTDLFRIRVLSYSCTSVLMSFSCRVSFKIEYKYKY